MTTTELGLAIETHDPDRAVVLKFHQDALTFPTTGAVHEEMRQAIEQAIAGGSRHLVFNWSNVSTLDSSGLGLMLIANQLASERGAKVHLCHISPMVAKLLHAMRIADEFGVGDTEELVLSEIRKSNRRRRRRRRRS